MTEEEVGGLEVSVEYPVVMEMMDCPQQLTQECLYFTWPRGGRKGLKLTVYRSQEEG